MIKPTPANITKEIKKLKAMRPNIRRYTAFGDDNWRKLDAQVEVLEKDLSEDEIYENDDEHGGQWSQDEVSNALEARQWLDGEIKELPSEGWKSLVKA